MDKTSYMTANYLCAVISDSDTGITEQHLLQLQQPLLSHLQQQLRLSSRLPHCLHACKKK